jgi:ubiquinone/menaquinone biosynthesis C-methylase UbiE
MEFARVGETLKLLSLLFSSGAQRRPQRIYDWLSTHNNLAENSLYLNLGYWKSATNYDDACQALAEQLGEYAALAPGHKVLDVGCGFGDQDAYWLNRFSPASITAVNITDSQLQKARQRFDDPRLNFVYANATSLPFEPGSFDRVLALESAFHFEPREAFFAEAARVLKPGGILAIADGIMTSQPASLMARRVAKLGRALWQTPECNNYGQDIYVQKLTAAGFHDIEITSIAEHVFAPFKAYARERVQAEEIQKRVNPLLRRIWSAPHGGFANLDYLLIRARI